MIKNKYRNTRNQKQGRHYDSEKGSIITPILKCEDEDTEEISKNKYKKLSQDS